MSCETATPGKLPSADGSNGFPPFHGSLVKLWIFPFLLIFDKDIYTLFGIPSKYNRGCTDIGDLRIIPGRR